MKVPSLSRWLGALVAALLVALCTGQPSYGATCSSITDQLSPSKSRIEITCLPAGTQHIGLAVMRNPQGAGVEYVSVSARRKTYTPPAADPVVDAQAWTGSKAQSGEPIGGWAGRLQTVPGGVEEAPHKARHKERPKEEQPAEEPHEQPHEEQPGGFLVGLNAGYWGSSELTDLQSLGVKVVRLDTPTSTEPWEDAGLKVIADMSGPYSSAGVSGVNTASYVARDVALVKQDPHLYALETLNEPGGSWFWGANSESAANREAYARLVIAVHNALVDEFGADRPLQLCSMDGGHASSDAFGEAWTKNTEALDDCGMLTNHPYGGQGAREQASLGNRALVERTWTLTGKPVAVTEVGFPTGHNAGDSLIYSETEQASSMYHFYEWASHTGHVPVVTEYGYRDAEEGGGYGIETHAGVHKEAYTAVQDFAAGLACTVCS